jgi:hypothetical protein
VQRDECARCLGHDRRLDGNRHSIPVAVRVHRGDSRARTPPRPRARRVSARARVPSACSRRCARSPLAPGRVAPLR